MKVRASILTLQKVDSVEEKAFLNAYHYQGYIPSTVCYGLYYGIELVEIMSFGTPRYNRKYDWELLRLCTKSDWKVNGGASRLLKGFISDYNTSSIISYCNESLFSGKVYEAIGFIKIASTKSYHYEKNGKTYHRSNFMKCKLLKKYPQYFDKTEKEIMLLLGYDRVEEIQATYEYAQNRKWCVYEILVGPYTYIGQHIYRNDNIDDGYSGSGTILKRAQKKYPDWKKNILVSNITNGKDATDIEAFYIDLDKKYSNNINILKSSGIEYQVRKQTPLIRDDHPSYGFKDKRHSEESKEKISNAMKAYCDENGSGSKGKHWKLNMTQEQLSRKRELVKQNGLTTKGKRWITDGKTNKCVNATDALPNGWRFGRTKEG